MNEQNFPTLTDDQKIELLRNAIRSSQGWRNLAQSLVGKPESAKEECIRLLNLLAGDKEIEMPILQEGEMTDFSDEPLPSTMKVKFASLLIQQLEDNITLLCEESA